MIVGLDAAFTLLALIGVVQCLAGLGIVRRFVKREAPPCEVLPPITVLRPLCGDEPELAEALVSGFEQEYPEFQIVFGVAREDDPARAVAEAVRRRFGERDSAVVVDATLYGTNRKVSNLINMMREAKHNLLLICDSDLHLAPGYLAALAAQIGQPGVGLVTALYTGLPFGFNQWSRLGASQISHSFLPGVLLSRAMGRQDCLGNTTLIRRDILEKIGGLEAFGSVLAEDNLMSRRVRELGLQVGLAATVTAAMVPEGDFGALWLHELRLVRTVRGVAPLGLAGSVLQYPLFWTLLTLLLPGDGNPRLAVFVVVWLVRAVCAREIDRALAGMVVRGSPPTAAWLLPIRDVLSVMEVAASFVTNRVVWRGFRMKA